MLTEAAPCDGVTDVRGKPHRQREALSACCLLKERGAVGPQCFLDGQLNGRGLEVGQELFEAAVRLGGKTSREDLAIFLHHWHPRTSDIREVPEPDSLGG